VSNALDTPAARRAGGASRVRRNRCHGFGPPPCAQPLQLLLPPVGGDDVSVMQFGPAAPCSSATYASWRRPLHRHVLHMSAGLTCCTQIPLPVGRNVELRYGRWQRHRVARVPNVLITSSRLSRNASGGPCRSAAPTAASRIVAGGLRTPRDNLAARGLSSTAGMASCRPARAAGMEWWAGMASGVTWRRRSGWWRSRRSRLSRPRLWVGDRSPRSSPHGTTSCTSRWFPGPSQYRSGPELAPGGNRHMEQSRVSSTLGGQQGGAADTEGRNGSRGVTHMVSHVGHAGRTRDC
jgi:hypothetical protein